MSYTTHVVPMMLMLSSALVCLFVCKQLPGQYSTKLFKAIVTKLFKTMFVIVKNRNHSILDIYWKKFM